MIPHSLRSKGRALSNDNPQKPIHPTCKGGKTSLYTRGYATAAGQAQPDGSLRSLNPLAALAQSLH
jgi:hypothetical protein